MAAAQSALIDWLSQGGPWGERPAVVETHAAMVFLAGARAFKLKKAVDLGYLDFSTVEKRHAVLARELELNRRTAPSLYLRLVPVTRAGDQFVLGGEQEVVDWLLEMRRFADDALLAHRADRGELDEATVERLAVHIARFHDAAESAAGDWSKAVARIAREDSDDLQAQAGIIDRGLASEVAALRERARAACAGVVARQSADMRRCHGDLHLGNVFLDGAQPTLFDCIEFDDFYATIPPLYDLAFLLMDLRMRGLPRFANRVLNTWLIHRDVGAWRAIAESLAALPLYLMLRAEIRAKVEGRQPGGAAHAQRYLTLARGFGTAAPPRLIAIGGLSGTGKSSLAKEIAWRTGQGAGAVHLRSDEIRKRLAGVDVMDRLPRSAYTPASSARVYGTLHQLAASALKAGQTVILDALFARESERDVVAKVARDAGVAFAGLWLDAPAEVLERRVTGRQGDASDADVAVLRQQLTYNLGRIAWTRIDAGCDAASVADAARTRLGLS